MLLILERAALLRARIEKLCLRAVERAGACVAGMHAAHVAGFMLLAFCVLIGPEAHAQTSITGDIASDSHWTKSSSPYIVNGNVLVRAGAVLIIDAGVVISMQPGSRLTLENGGINAKGSLAEPIKVSSSKAGQAGSGASPGDYGPWTFTSGASAQTLLEHVEFEYGQGLQIHGSAPTLNYVYIHHSNGPAISLDLSASPKGVGNRAEANSINAVVVPAGDIIGDVEWALRGIPYLVQAGTVSVGVSPKISSVSPRAIERGQTVSLAIDGVRLDGLGGVAVDNPGVALTPIGNSTATRASLQAKVAADAALGAATLKVTVAAGELTLPAAFSVVQAAPAISAISPEKILTGSGVSQLLVTGRNYTAESEVLANSGSLPTQMISSTELRAELPQQDQAGTLSIQVRTPDGATAGDFLVSNALNLLVEQQVPPAVSFEPTPIAMPPDSRARDITLRLSRADTRDHLLNLSISDTSKARVNQPSLTIAAGQTMARISITPLAQGSVVLRMQSSTLGEASVPMFITQDFSGINTSHASPVGVFVEGGPAVGDKYEGVVQGLVGVGVGSVLNGLSPSGWAAGTSQHVALSGVAIPTGVQLMVAPEAGISISSSTVSADGSTAEFDVQIASDAQVGPRRLVVRDANGSLLTFAHPEKAAVFVGAGLPKIESISPMVMLRDSTVPVIVRGRNLQGAKLDALPGEGLVFDAAPVINAEGTEITTTVQVQAGAVLGDRLLRATNSVGASTLTASSANTLKIVSGFEATYRWDAPLVGVTVGEPAPVMGEITPVPTQSVGVVLGASVTSVSPRVAIVGHTVDVTVKGQGLQAVNAVTLVPADAVTIGSHSVNADGTELTFRVEVDADASANLRRLVLGTESGPMVFADVNDSAFRVSKPVPEVDSVTPYLLVRGGAAQQILVRGRYLDSTSDVRVVPAEGVTVIRPLSVNTDGTELTLSLQAATGAALGNRSLIVTTPAGDSSSVVTSHNTVRVVSELGLILPDVPAPLVGVLVGERESVAYDGTLSAPLVGVMVDQPPSEVETLDTQAITIAVGVLVGPMATAQSVEGWLQGASGNLRISGVGLQAVESVGASPADGLLFDAPIANADGTELTVGITVAQDASLGGRRLRLVTADGQIVWLPQAAAGFGIGHLPTIDSISPIVLNAGETVEMTVRGKDLKSVSGIKVTPASGVRLLSAPTWSQDASSEVLKLSLKIEAEAAAGERLLQLVVPGGSTPATPSPVNTFRVVPAQ